MTLFDPPQGKTLCKRCFLTPPLGGVYRGNPSVERGNPSVERGNPSVERGNSSVGQRKLSLRHPFHHYNTTISPLQHNYNIKISHCNIKILHYNVKIFIFDT
jgi:hypothetical protein